MIRARPRGFTLIEALLALAIFGVIAVLAYRATASLFSRFEADIRQAVPRSVRAGAGREPAWLGTMFGGQSALVFTRAGSEFSPEPAPAGQRIGYRLREGTIELAIPRTVRLTLTLADGARIDRWFTLR